VRIFLIVVGVAMALFGGACGLSGLTAFRAIDSDGYVNGNGRLVTPAAAITSRVLEFEDLKGDERSGDSTRLRITASARNGKAITVGVGRADVVDPYLATGSSEEARDFHFEPFRYTHVASAGSGPLAPPDAALFVTSSSGSGKQQLTWPFPSDGGAGAYRVVIANADGSTGLDADVKFGVRFPYLRGFAIAAMVIGALFLALGIALIAWQVRRRGRPPEEDAAPA
jgi:hypothetical protein